MKTLQQQIGVAAYVQPDASRPEDEYHTVTSRWLGNQGRVPKGHVRKQLKKQIGVLRDELQKLQDNTDLSVRRSLARKQSDAAKHLKTQMAELNGLLGSKRSTNLYLMKSLGLEPLKDYGGYGVFGW